MPQMYCMGTLLEIPENGKICPKLPTNMVVSGTKCLVSCDSGSPNIESVKCEEDGWSSRDVYCSGVSTGLIVGLMFGLLLLVCIVAFVYAKCKGDNKKAKNSATNGAKNQSMSRAAKIAARNDMVITGVVSKDAIKSGVVQQVPRKNPGKLVTGQPAEDNYRHHSTSSQVSNQPPHFSNEVQDERSRNSTPSSKSSKERRSRKSNGDYPQMHRKHRQYYDEYTEEVDLGYHEGMPAPTLEGQIHSVQDNGPMYPDYYGPGAQRHSNQRYRAMDQNYYSRDVGSYPDHYLNGMDNMAYGHGGGYNGKPYHVPI